MPTVNSTIQKIIKEKNAGIVSGSKSIEKILRELQFQVQHEIGQAALGSWNAYNLRKMLNAIEKRIADFDLAAKAELGGFMEKSWQKGIEMIDTPMAIAEDIFMGGFGLSREIISTLQGSAFYKIDGLASDALDRLQSELSMGILGGKTPHEVSVAVGKNLKNPSIFKTIHSRAMVITQAEMGRTFSVATQGRMEQAKELVPDLEKQWKHAGHPTIPRPTHVAANNQHVKVDEPFQIGSIKMMHPRDPAAPVSEIIRCGCDHIPYNPQWN